MLKSDLFIQFLLCEGVGMAGLRSVEIHPMWMELGLSAGNID